MPYTVKATATNEETLIATFEKLQGAMVTLVGQSITAWFMLKKLCPKSVYLFTDDPKIDPLPNCFGAMSAYSTTNLVSVAIPSFDPATGRATTVDWGYCGEHGGEDGWMWNHIDGTEDQPTEEDLARREEYCNCLYYTGDALPSGRR